MIFFKQVKIIEKELDDKCLALKTKLNLKKEKIQSLKEKNSQYSNQVSKLLGLIEKKESKDKYFNNEKENENLSNFTSKPSMKPILTEKFPTKNEKTNKYSELEKCALKILNDFD